MATYRVKAKYITYLYADIKANSEEEAWDKAEEMDGGEFTEEDTYDDSWEIYDCEEIEWWDE